MARTSFEDDSTETVKRLVMWAFIIIAAVIVIIIVFGAIVIIPAGSRGVLLVWGAPQDQPLDPGLHFITPIVDTVQQMDVRTQKYEATAEAATKDLLDVSADVAVNYHIDPSQVVTIYKQLGTQYQDSIIQPAVQEVVKAATAQYNAKELITERPAVKNLIDNGLMDRLSQRGIIMETTSITDFKFPTDFNAAITAAQTATQKVIEAQNDLTRIQVEAQQAIAQAQGIANATLIQATANAQSIEIRGQALKNNPQVAQLEWINKWNGILPNYMLGSNSNLLLNIPTTTTG